MDLEFIDLVLLLKADKQEVPHGLEGEALFLTVKSPLLELLAEQKTKLYHFGYAPDNTADGQDELLHDGTLYSIIVNNKYVGVDLESDTAAVKKAFYELVLNNTPSYCSVTDEAGETITETTIELRYLEVV